MDVLLSLVASLDAEIDRLNVEAGRGTAKDFGDYKFACGVIRGLYLAKEQIILMRERLEQDDD